MFKYEVEMIPVLKDGLARIYKTQNFATEFNTGNGVADLVFSKYLNDQPIIFNDYTLMSLFIRHLNSAKKLDKQILFENFDDKVNIKKLLLFLECNCYVAIGEDQLIRIKKYKPHAEKMVAIEAKLKDWKSGINQALRYQFFSHKSFLAFPAQYIHRVDIKLLQQYNIGLIAVCKDNIEILHDPIEKKPIDLISYYFLSDCFAKKIKSSNAEFSFC